MRDYTQQLQTASYGAVSRVEALADLLSNDDDLGGVSLLLRDIGERLLRAVECEPPGLDPTEDTPRQ